MYGKTEGTGSGRSGNETAVRRVWLPPAPGGGKAAGQGKGAAPPLSEPGARGTVSQKKRRRPVHLHVMVSEEELALIRERMAEAGVRKIEDVLSENLGEGYRIVRDNDELSPIIEWVDWVNQSENDENEEAIRVEVHFEDGTEETFEKGITLRQIWHEDVL